MRRALKRLVGDRSALVLAPIMVGAAILRLVDLGYSHFQGDEISALYPIGAAFPESLIEQMKGPVQLLVTLAVHLVSGQYGEWQTRLPFSLASLLTVYVIFVFVRRSFGVPTALWAAALVGSCGLLVAFGRIAQYQAFVMLAVGASAVFLQRWMQTDEPLPLYLGMAAIAFGVLSHYDTLTFLPTLLLLLILGLRGEWTRARLGHLILAGVLALVLAGAFYGPFVFRPGFASVADYLGGRVASGLGWRPFALTNELLGLYLPPLYLPALAVLVLAGLGTAVRRTTRPWIFVLAAWFGVPFAFYMFLGGQPRSHIYMYVLPGLILAAVGIEAAVTWPRSQRARTLARVGAWAAILGFASITYYMLVDHAVEHPWERKTVLGYELPNLVDRRIQGVFGFPYRRGLEAVGDMYRAGILDGTFDSNERDTTVEFYFDAPRSSPPITYFDDPGSSPPDYYIYVHRPFSLRRELPETVRKTYRWIGAVQERGRTTIDIYAAPWKAP